MGRQTLRKFVRLPRSPMKLAIAGSALVVAITAGVVVATEVGAAASGTRVVPNGTLCTAPLRADQGVVLSGSSTVNVGNGPVWSVRVASTASGPDAEVMRTPASTLPPTSVVPPAPGTWFFRGCLRNTGPLTTTIQIQLNPI